MKTLIILHGWQSSKEKWNKVKEIIMKAGIEVIVPDLPGFKEETSLRSAWNLDDYINWFNNFSSGKKDFFLLGHSFGGRMAIKFAGKYPKKISGLILVGAAGIKPKKTVFRVFLNAAARAGKTFSFLPFFTFFRKMFYRFIVKRSDYVKEEGALAETFKRVIDEDLTPLLPGVKTPTLIIWGEKDESTPLSDAYVMKNGIAGATLEIMKDIGHAPYLESPEPLADLVINFAAKLGKK